MIKTSVYLSPELDAKLGAESLATGVSKAELIRRGIALVLQASDRPRKAKPLPTFRSGSPRSAEQLDDSIYDHIKSRSARR